MADGRDDGAHVDDALREALHVVDAPGGQRRRKEVREVLTLASGPEVRRSMEHVDQRGQGAGGSGLA